MLVARCLAFATLATACVSNPTPCAAAGVCGEGQECLANRCVPYGGQPVPANDQRILLELQQVAVWSKALPDDGLPPAIVLGDSTTVESKLILRFATPAATLKIDAAFLLLYPMQAAAPAGANLHFEVRQLAAPWNGKAAPQSFGRVAAVGTAQAGAPFPLRIDVTDLAQRLQSHPEQDHGVVVAAAGTATPGASYHTGAQGPAPQLEIYAAPEAVTP